MTLFAPTLDESRTIALAQQARAERLAARITKARHSVMRGEDHERILWLLDHDTIEEPA
jgi:hypothetical protein